MTFSTTRNACCGSVGAPRTIIQGCLLWQSWAIEMTSVAPYKLHKNTLKCNNLVWYTCTSEKSINGRSWFGLVWESGSRWINNSKAFNIKTVPKMLGI